MKKFIYIVLMLGATFTFRSEISAQLLKNPDSVNGLPDYTFANIEFTDNKTGFIIGEDFYGKHSIILGTEDTGNTWNLVPHPTIYNGDASHLYDISFSDPMNGWVSGDMGWLLHTVDGGKNWVKKSIGASGPLGSVYCLDTNNIWISRDSVSGPTVYRTNDGFESWESYYTGIKTVLWDMFFMNADTGIAALGWCDRFLGTPSDIGGFILHTTNGGVDWTVQKHDTTILGYYRIFFLNDTTGYVAGSDGSLLRTDDGGVNWSDMKSGTDMHIHGVYFANADTGIITTGVLTGWAGKIYRTTDGGENWTQPDIIGSNNHPIFALAFAGECTLVAPQDGSMAPEGFNILRSTDCGATWESIAEDSINPTGIEAKSAAVMKIYPNPSLGQLTIETESRQTSIIDILSSSGQLLFTSEMEGTTHQIDLSSFPKGVFFITLRSKEFVRTQKIIKL